MLPDVSEIYRSLLQQQHRWLVTGVAGFIGSNLLEVLLQHNQLVVGLDDFETGHQRNLDDVKSVVGDAAWSNFSFIHGSITDPDVCQQAVAGVDFVLHQAALGSVPKSFEDPLRWNANNITGHLNMLYAAKEAGSKGFVYASSSAVYGDCSILPIREEVTGTPLSPYALTKWTNELYGQVFASGYGFSSVGLRYFNVFGKRQDPNGAYAAVIPKWVDNMVKGLPCVINGDGSTTRDFCYIANVVQANIRAAFYAASMQSTHHAFNVGVGEQTSLLELHQLLADAVGRMTKQAVQPATCAPFRIGDIQHSLADTAKIRSHLAYVPTHTLATGIEEAVAWYVHTASNA
jgi:UDP-N-acetylglucosamine 4-epimerase